VPIVRLYLHLTVLRPLSQCTSWQAEDQLLLHFLAAITAHYNTVLLIIIGDIVTIWNVVFANKTRKLGRIWMKLGRWGRGLKRLSLARFQRNRAMAFRDSAKKWVAEALFFVTWTTHHALLPLSLNRFPPNFPRTRVQIVACNTWFHIPEKFPLRGQICRKNLFFRVPYLWSGYGPRETVCDAYTVSIPWAELSWAELSFISHLRLDSRIAE